MSSAGHVMDSINRMKANRSLRTKRSSFNVIEANTFRPTTEKRVYQFKSITPELRKRISLQMRKERRTSMIKELIILIILIFSTILILF